MGILGVVGVAYAAVVTPADTPLTPGLYIRNGRKIIVK